MDYFSLKMEALAVFGLLGYMNQQFDKSCLWTFDIEMVMDQRMNCK